MFEQIKKNSPKAWEKFKDYYRRTYAPEEVQFEALIGHLFTFLDDQGIYINTLLSNGVFYKCEIYKLSERIHKGSRDEIDVITYGWQSQFSQSRPEAWEAAIPKAFEILQKQLEEK